MPDNEERYIQTGVTCPLCGESLSQDRNSSAEMEDPNDPDGNLPGIVLCCFNCGTHVTIYVDKAKEHNIPYVLK